MPIDANTNTDANTDANCDVRRYDIIQSGRQGGSWWRHCVTIWVGEGKITKIVGLRDPQATRLRRAGELKEVSADIELTVGHRAPEGCH